MKIWDRKSERYVQEIEYEKRKLEFLYQTIIGRILLRLIVTTRWFSKIDAIRKNSKKSARKINDFVKTYKIDMTPYSGQKYNSYAEFFTRKRLCQNHSKDEELIAIADGKLLAIPIKKGTRFQIKESIYEVKDLIQNQNVGRKFKNGICLIYRLTVDDYHRYVFLDRGKVLGKKKIKGVLHTVRPISNRHQVYIRNTRECTILKTENFGNVIQVEIGALLVGKIHNTETNEFNKMDEKGYFALGGSTIVQLFQENTISIDEDIMEQSKKGIETKVSIGEVIGRNVKKTELLF